jgi:hypothetical protein
MLHSLADYKPKASASMRPFASPDGGCSRPHHDDDNDLREPLLDGPTSDGRISSATVGCAKEEEKDEESWPDFVLTWLVLPCVVWLDFWLVVVRSSGSSNSSSSSSNNNSQTCASVTSVHVDFVLFIVASLLYRSTHGKGQGRTGSKILRLLLPGRDAAMVTMLLLTMGHRTCAAYQVLLWSTVALALAVVLGAYCYGFQRRDDDENDKATVDGTGERGIFFGTEEQAVEGDEEKVAWSGSARRSSSSSVVMDL